MKKLITTAAFVLFGTMFISAQTTPKKESNKAKAETKINSTETKLDTSIQPNGMNRTVDTASSNNTLKIQQNPDRLQTTPQNSTPQNPTTTIPDNSTATPQVQPVSPVEPKTTK